jgi:hypothetical protein
MAESTAAGNTVLLVQEGRAALIAGDTYAARQHFRQALLIDADNVDALIGMAGAVRPYREKREHLERALRADPGNAEARAIMAQVEARLAAGEVLAPGGVQVREPGSAAAPPPDAPAAAPPAAGTLYCYNHPRRETGLRCTNCDRPICAECVRPAAVGQLCPECAKARRPTNYKVSAGSLAISAAVALFFGLVASIAAGLALSLIGFFSLYLAIFIGPMAGELLVRLLERVNRKRGRAIQIAVGVCYGVAAAPVLLVFFSVGLLIFTIAAIVTAVTRLR